MIFMSSPASDRISGADTRPAVDGRHPDAVIRVEGVRQVFPAVSAQEPVVALDRIEIEIGRQEMVTFIGPSGCGKSTLLNVIGGMVDPTEGTASVDGQQVRGPLPKKIAYIFQESALLPWSSVLDNIKVALEFQGVPRQKRHERAVAALKAVGLARFAASYPHQLSGGMKQRVALARGLSLETDILLMDEPFAALDEQTRMVFGEDLSALLARTRKTIVLVTHSLAEAVFLSDRIFVFTARPGSIKGVLTIDEPHPRNPSFMTSDKFNDIRNRLYTLLREEVRRAMAEAYEEDGAA
jgi:NitT/TauT family transport system ATP-binding protein